MSRLDEMERLSTATCDICKRPIAECSVSAWKITDAALRNAAPALLAIARAAQDISDGLKNNESIADAVDRLRSALVNLEVQP